MIKWVSCPRCGLKCTGKELEKWRVCCLCSEDREKRRKGQVSTLLSDADGRENVKQRGIENG